MGQGWYGFDLDGTTAIYDGWKGPGHIGQPIERTVRRIKQLLATGQKVKIFTARVCSAQKVTDKIDAEKAIKTWCKKYIGQELEVTAEKDWDMIEFYDDRCIPVEFNTGEILLKEVI